MEKLLKKLVEAPSISGFEDNIRDLMKKELKGHVSSIKVDKVGNLIAQKGKGSPRIMISAHMDELGLMVKFIDKDGSIKFETVGGWDERILPARKVVVYGSKGPVTGVIGTKPVHLQEKDDKKRPIDKKELSIDVGTDSDKETERLGIQVGDFITNHGELSRMAGSKVTGHGLDDRVGCLELIEVMKSVKKFKGTLYAVGTVQEEMGLIGVRGSMYGINPDVMLSLDTTYAKSSEMKPGEVNAELGKGPVVEIKDAMSFMNPRIKNWVLKTAKAKGIKLQYDVSSGGAQDSSVGAITREGIASGAVSTPTRYLHTPVEVADMSDVKNVVVLVSEMIKNAGKYF